MGATVARSCISWHHNQLLFDTQDNPSRGAVLARWFAQRAESCVDGGRVWVEIKLTWSLMLYCCDGTSPNCHHLFPISVLTYSKSSTTQPSQQSAQNVICGGRTFPFSITERHAPCTYVHRHHHYNCLQVTDWLLLASVGRLTKNKLLYLTKLFVSIVTSISRQQSLHDAYTLRLKWPLNPGFHH